LAAKGAVAGSTPIQGWGERKPVAPNTKLDGSDDPQGRQKNRRVEVVLDLCKEQP
jgi:outer membrane protein OmpA-like peptidoglycan-associated protein